MRTTQSIEDHVPAREHGDERNVEGALSGEEREEHAATVPYRSSDQSGSRSGSPRGPKALRMMRRCASSHEA